MPAETYLVIIRRDPKYGPVRPNAEQLDGCMFKFREGFRFDDLERPEYMGEAAMIPWDPHYPADAPHWIASGDLLGPLSDD